MPYSCYALKIKIIVICAIGMWKDTPYDVKYIKLCGKYRDSITEAISI